MLSSDLNVGIVSGLGGGLIAAVALRWVRRRGGPPIHEGGALVLTRTRAYRSISIGIAVLWTPLAIWATSPNVWASGASQRYGPPLIVAFSLFVILMLLAAFVRRIRVTPDGMASRSLWSGSRFLPWTDVQRVDYAVLLQWLTFRGPGGNRIRVDGMFAGLEEFLEVARERLPAAADAPGLVEFRRYLALPR